MSGTSGTPRTQSYLLTTEFQDGQAPGSITPQRMRDFVVSAPNLTPIFNALKYGAIGSGSSNPASTKYGSLAALQAVYGATMTVYTATGTSTVTVAVTQELDWLAHQAAVNAAAAVGGVVYSPPCSGYVFTNANSVSDGSGTLTFPLASPFSPAGGVSWRGDFPGTVCSWPNDLGSGKFAVLCGGRASSSSTGFFEGLIITGPGAGSTLNASSCNMQGIATNDRRAMRWVMVGGFNYGINVVGGQFLWEDVYLGYAGGNNFYGIYFDNPQSTNFGNMQFIRVLSRGLKSCIGVHHAASIVDTHFLSCGFATSPYVIFKETNSGSPTQPIVLYESKFELCQFEGVGNALVCDDTATQAARVCELYYTDFVKCQYAWNATYKISAISAFSIIDVWGIVNVQIIDPIQLGTWTPGSVSMFACNFAAQFLVRGDVVSLIANCVTASINMFSNTGSGFGGGAYPARFENTVNGNWSGAWVFNTDTVAVAGSPVVTTSFANGCKASTGGTSDGAVGVLMYNPTPGTASSQCIYADEGFVTVKCGANTIAVGDIVRTATGGVCIAASGSNDTTSPIIGVAQSASSSNVCTVKLQRLS